MNSLDDIERLPSKIHRCGDYTHKIAISIFSGVNFTADNRPYIPMKRYVRRTRRRRTSKGYRAPTPKVIVRTMHAALAYVEGRLGFLSL